MVRNRIAEDDAANGYILDGYPRNLAQLEGYLEFDQPTHAVLITLSDDEAVKRLSGRRTCEGCGKIYHIEHNPPKVKDVCDECNAALIQRGDDQPEAIKERLRIYHENTEPMVAKFEEMGILKKVDGSGSIDEVYNGVKGAIQ
jgi:adenylate kinase